ncbi:MAG: tail fiber domain-containing protein [Desulfobacteraceae bacterium]|nr:tail fiber domain-containing protein [Desulfobacteraceae bacterium]
MKKAKLAVVLFVAYVLISISVFPAIAADTDSLVVTDSGNVGIGTDSPSESLEINGGGIQLNGSYGIGFNSEIPYYDNVTRDAARIYFLNGFGGTNNDFLVVEKTDMHEDQENPDGGIVFVNKNGKNESEVSLAIKGNGNIGIGTLDPSEKLELKDGGLQLNGSYGIGFNGEIPYYDNVTLDAARIYFLNGFGGTNNDFLVIEKTDMNEDQETPDGGIVFVNKNGKNESEVSLAIRGDGNVGIGKIDPDDKLDVAGYVRANGTRLSSDARWKENIEPLDNALEIVAQLRGVSYDWVDPSRGESRQIGVIAQEVEKVLPQVVHTGSQGYKSVEYSKLVAPLIEAVKALKAENQALRTSLEQVHSRLDTLENK